MKNTTVKYNKCLNDLYALFRDFKETLNKEQSEYAFALFNMYLVKNMSDSAVVGDGEVSSNTFTSLGSACQSLLQADMEGKTIHIFLKNESLYSLLESIPVKDIEGMTKYLLENGIKEKEEITRYEENGNISKVKESETYCLYYCIHFPESIDKDGLSVKLSYKNDELVCDYIEGPHMATFSSESQYLKKPLYETDYMDQKKWQLMVNTFFYMKTFPECVKNGVPKGFRFENPSASKKVELGVSEKLVEKKAISNHDSGRIVIPHFRKGHFRYLASDYYVNKKGTFIWIDETMVKAKDVKTVVPLEESGEV